MPPSYNKSSLLAVIALGSLAALASSCLNSDDFSGGTAGTSSGGTGGASTTGGTAGSVATGGGGATAGGTGGVATAGTGGAATGGGGAATAGTGGAAIGGGGAATAGTGGAATGGGGATAGGGTGGTGGTGGATATDTLVYDFEDGVDDWASSDTGVVVASSADRAVTGTKSLKVTVPALAVNTGVAVQVDGPQFWPGAVLKFHIWTPAGTDGLYLQTFAQFDNSEKFVTAPAVVTRGGWAVVSYTIPNIFPGGLQAVGVQFWVGATGPFAGGNFYIDSITATDGYHSCATGIGVGHYTFETAPDVAAWSVQGDPVPTDTVISMSPTHFMTGANSLKVSLTAVPAAVGTTPTQRLIGVVKVAANKTKIYCGQQVTFNVWSPPGSEAITFSSFAQYDNYSGFSSNALAGTITRGGWTWVGLFTPHTGPGGLETIGIQFNNTGTTAFTGDFYIDEVIWYPPPA